MSQEFDRSSRSQIRSADTDHEENIGILSDLLCRFFDACEFFFVIVNRKVNPSKESFPAPVFESSFSFACAASSLIYSISCSCTKLHAFE